MDRFKDLTDSLTSPATEGAEVVPGPTPLAQASRALWIGGGGDLAIETVGGTEVTLAGVQGGTLLPIRVRAVRSAGTTATGIVALW